MGGEPLGSIIYTAVRPIFKIYFIIILGFFLAKKNILSVTTCRDISDMIVTAIMPCLIFNNIVTNLQSSDIKNLGIIFLTAAVLFGSGCLVAGLIYLLTNGPKRWLGGVLSVGFFANISDLPIAYLQTFSKGGLFTVEEGNKGVAYVCIFLAAQVLCQFSLGGYRFIEWDFRDELKPRNLDDESNVSNNDEKPSQSSDDSGKLDLGKKMSSEEDNEEDTDNNETFSNIDDHSGNVPPSLRVRRYLSRATNFTALEDRSIRSTLDGVSMDGGAVTRYYSLNPTRTTDLRKQRSQGIDEVINEYSESNNLKKEGSIISPAFNDIGIAMESSHESEPPHKGFNFKSHGKDVLKSFLTPNSMSLIISIAIAMAPPLKALFVKSKFHMPSAPDHQPPLAFVIDFASYVGAASVPLGLLILGATLSRLTIKSIPKGFWKTALGCTILRAVILPILGVGVTTGINNGGWYGDDKIVRFVSVLLFGVPTATSLVYFTAFYTDPNSEDHLQMDCLALCLISQYLVLYISLPFLITFTTKVSLGY